MGGKPYTGYRECRKNRQECGDNTINDTRQIDVVICDNVEDCYAEAINSKIFEETRRLVNDAIFVDIYDIIVENIEDNIEWVVGDQIDKLA